MSTSSITQNVKEEACLNNVLGCKPLPAPDSNEGGESESQPNMSKVVESYESRRGRQNVQGDELEAKEPRFLQLRRNWLGAGLFEDGMAQNRRHFVASELNKDVPAMKTIF